MEDLGQQMSKELEQLLTKMLVENPIDRYSFDQCREFFEKNFPNYKLEFKSSLKTSAKFWSGTQSKIVNTK